MYSSICNSPTPNLSLLTPSSPGNLKFENSSIKKKKKKKNKEMLVKKAETHGAQLKKREERGRHRRQHWGLRATSKLFLTD